MLDGVHEGFAGCIGHVLFRPNNQAGGSNATGNWGYMMCVDEITQQSKDMARLPGVFVV